MAITIRSANKGEGASILNVHRRAIHEIARAEYPQEVLDAWGAPISEADCSRMCDAFDRKIDRGEIVLVAETGNSIAGFGEMVPDQCLLLAVYVNPDFKRRGVGTALLDELERIAREKNVPHLEMDSSLTAVPFYTARGYNTIEHGFHALRNGFEMPCVRMRKELA